MSEVSRLLSPLESMQKAWAYKLRDFRQWCSPSGQTAIRDWKTRRLEAAIIVSKTNMIDDAEAMLKAIAERDNAQSVGKLHAGMSVSLPVMITAISTIENPPDRDIVIGQSQWVNVVIPSDPMQRAVQMRTTPVAYRAQIAFFASSSHAASAIANQFVNFWKHEGKRTFSVGYEIGYAGKSIIRDNWDFRVVENTLFPDKADVNLPDVYVVTVDCTIVGVEPTVVGLGAYGDDITDTGEPDGSIPPGLPPIPGTRLPEDELGKFVIEADVFDDVADSQVRIAIDPDTRVITETKIK